MDIDPELPWGNWLRIEAGNGRFAYVDDATGQTWPSPRSALWNGRFGMPDRNGGPPDELLELVHAVLAATVRRVPGHREQLNDLFAGNALFQRMFDAWLGSTGLTVFATNGTGAVELTDEGWSVLHMLSATRPYDVRRNRPCAATIAMLGELGLGPEEREVRFERLEREAIRWDAAFLRRTEGGKSSIVLTKRAGGGDAGAADRLDLVVRDGGSAGRLLRLALPAPRPLADLGRPRRRVRIGEADPQTAGGHGRFDRRTQ